MSQLTRKIVLGCLCGTLLCSMALEAQQVGIGTNTPANSAILDVSSTTSGLLPPRMTAAQRNAIASPANGLIVFDIDSAALMLRSAGGWRRLTTTATPGGFWEINGTNIFNLNTGKVGIGTTTPAARLHVADSSVVFSGLTTNTLTPGIAPPVEGPGIRMLWYPQKAAFRAGFAGFNTWDRDNIGTHSFAGGQATLAKGRSSAAFGLSTEAIGDFSTATGIFTRSRAFGSIAVGAYNNAVDNPNPVTAAPDDRIFQIGNGTADNARSNAITVLRSGHLGIGTTNPLARLHVADSNVLFFASGEPAGFPLAPLAINGPGRRMLWFPGRAAFRVGYAEHDWDQDSIGLYSFAAGYRSKATEVLSVAFGELTSATGFGSFTAGGFTNASNRYATAFGEGTRANGVASTSMGSSTLASGGRALAVGYESLASGGVSTAMGTRSQATGVSSLATGFETKATNNDAAAFNQLTIASGVGSFAAGTGTRAKGLSAAAFGRYNDDTDTPNPNATAPGDRIFQIGNGTADNARSNALTVLRNGNVGIGFQYPHAPLQFGAEQRNRKIVLAENANNDHQYFGFGMNLNVLRYQTDGIGSDHVFYAAAGPSVSNELVRIKGNGYVGFGQSNPNAPLHFNNNLQNRKIILYENANNDHQYYGFGINGGVLRYQTDAINADHVFYAAVNSTSSTELMRIKGNGAVGFNTDDPNVYGHGGSNQFVEIRNRQSGNNAQSHLILSTSGTAGSMGGITWSTRDFVGERKAAFIGAAFEGGTNDALFQVMLRNNGNLAQRFRVNSNGSAWLQGALTQNSDETLKKNIEPIANASDLLQQLHGYRYQWKDESADADKQLGLLAQEVQKVLPELVQEGDNGKLGVNYSGLIPVLLEALKEQRSEIDKLKALVKQFIDTRQ